MIDLIIPFNQAKRIVKNGFNQPTYRVFDELGYLQDEEEMIKLSLKYTLAPTYEQVVMWFREEYNTIILLHFNGGVETFTFWIRHNDKTIECDMYSEYEDKNPYVVYQIAFQRVMNRLFEQ